MGKWDVCAGRAGRYEERDVGRSTMWLRDRLRTGAIRERQMGAQRWAGIEQRAEMQHPVCAARERPMRSRGFHPSRVPATDLMQRLQHEPVVLANTASGKQLRVWG